MNNIKNIAFTFLAVVGVHFVALAQDPGDFGGDPNPVDAPIDTYVCILLTAGLMYVFYKYRNLKSKESIVS